MSKYTFRLHKYEERVFVINHKASGGRALSDLEDHGISIRSAAKRMGVSASYLSDLTKGRRNWSDSLEKRFQDAVCGLILEGGK